MISKIIKTPLAKAIRASIDFVKYFAAFAAASAFPAILFDTDLIDKFATLALMPALLPIVGSYDKPVLF